MNSSNVALIAIGATMLLVGLVFPASMVQDAVSETRFRRGALQATGTLVRNEEVRGGENSTWYYTVNFTPRDGGIVLGRTRKPGYAPRRLGSTVTVFYHPENPAVVDIDRFQSPAERPGCAGNGCGLLFLSVLIVPWIILGVIVLLLGIFTHS